MGDRVGGWIEIGPFDEEILSTTGSGRELIELVEGFGFDEREVTEQDGVLVLRADAYEANYGTTAFEGAGFDTLAASLGLWLAWGDEGSIEWGRNHSVFSPDGTAHHFDGSQCHETVVSQAGLLALCAAKTDREVVAALRRHFDEGERSLGAWSLSEPEPEEEEEDDEDEGYDEEACSECGGSREDGEGCDGLCGDCADRVDLALESEGAG